jgi:hypothetical protein
VKRRADIHLTDFTVIEFTQLHTRHHTPSQPTIMRNITIMEEHPYDDPDPAPIYILFILAVLFCACFAWLGSVAIRLYFHKGALAPKPEHFVILPAYLRGHQRRVTAFSIPAPEKIPACELARLSRLPLVNIVDDVDQLPETEVRAFLAEQQHFSRLPAFGQVNSLPVTLTTLTDNDSGRLW